MRLNLRILLINFAIVVLVLVISGAAFYSIMLNVLTSQRITHLLESANDFNYSFDNALVAGDATVSAYVQELETNKWTGSSFLTSAGVDFLFAVENDSLIYSERFLSKPVVTRGPGVLTVSEFGALNPLAIVKRYRSNLKKEYYYGIILSKDAIISFSRSIRADLAIFQENKLIEVTNELVNQKYANTLHAANSVLSSKNDYDVYTGDEKGSYLLATIYRIKEATYTQRPIKVIIFSTSSEPERLSENIREMVMILALTGTLLSLILTYLFTAKFRKQVSDLSLATQHLKAQDFKNRIEVTSNDELGQLARAFNAMIDELEASERIKAEYTEFITLLNKTPGLKEISSDILLKIIKTTGYHLGAIYLIKGEEAQLAGVQGFEAKGLVQLQSEGIIQEVVRTREKMHLSFAENPPVVKALAFSLEVREMLILPIEYNQQVIAVLQLAAVVEPFSGADEYINKIREQLAIALFNASAVQRLEDLVYELRVLNEDYEKQNKQIKEQNAELLRLHKVLQDKTNELDIQRLKAEEATRLKSQFLATMSHELRTPLNALLGLTELVVEDKSLTPKNHERLMVALQSGKRLLTLINGILDLSKIEAGRMEVYQEVFILDDLLKELNNALTPLASKKGLEFSIVNTLQGKMKLRSDKAKLLQILLNLGGNAVKFTEKGSVTIKVSLSENNRLLFGVRDTGIGISSDSLGYIFEAFRQADSSTTRRFSGTGLGLSISQGFATLLNGTITANSVEGSGSVFTFSMPVDEYEFIKEQEILQAETGLSQTGNEELSDEADNNEYAVSLNAQVLIVDDDPDSLFAMNEIVKQIGCATIIAKNGVQCIEVLESSLPDAILLDIMMPVMDGYEVIQRIRETEKFKKLPVIAVTAKDSLEEREVLLMKGFNAVVAKPVNAATLTFKLIRLLQNEKNTAHR